MQKTKSEVRRGPPDLFSLQVNVPPFSFHSLPTKQHQQQIPNNRAPGDSITSVIGLSPPQPNNNKSKRHSN